MPSKKGKSKSKGKKGPPKMSRKEKKLRAKYRSLKVEDKAGKEISAVELRRDELEWEVERIQNQVTINRSERIRFQLERDFLYDVMQTYWKKFKCLQTEEENKIANTNRMAQDADDNKTIKGIEGKHFRYDAQINCTAMDVRDEIRKKRLKDMLERQWQTIALDIEEQNDILAKNAVKYRQKIDETREKLDDLQKYVDDHANQLSQFLKDMHEQMENSIKIFHLVRRMEFQVTEERWGEFIWKLSRNFELQYQSMKNYYNDASHSNLTLIFTLQDWMNECIDKRNLYLDEIAKYEELMTDAHAKMPALKKDYKESKIKHDLIERTKQGIKTTKKEVSILQASVNHHKQEYRQILQQFQKTIAERDNFRNNCEELIGEAIAAYTNRYKTDQLEVEVKEGTKKYLSEIARLQGHYPTPNAFFQEVTPYKNLLDRKDEHLEKQKLTCMRIQKQSEDLRCSLEARFLSVALKKKHAAESPEQAVVLGKATRLDWGPANLVAKRFYPSPSPPMEKLWCPPSKDESEIKLCLTDSIKGFLGWKEKKRLDRKKKDTTTSNGTAVVAQ